jgi:hypothetical protein
MNEWHYFVTGPLLDNLCNVLKTTYFRNTFIIRAEGALHERNLSIAIICYNENYIQKFWNVTCRIWSVSNQRNPLIYILYNTFKFVFIYYDKNVLMQI